MAKGGVARVQGFLDVRAFRVQRTRFLQQCDSGVVLGRARRLIQQCVDPAPPLFGVPHRLALAFQRGTSGLQRLPQVLAVRPERRQGRQDRDRRVVRGLAGRARQSVADRLLPLACLPGVFSLLLQGALALNEQFGDVTTGRVERDRFAQMSQCDLVRRRGDRLGDRLLHPLPAGPFRLALQSRFLPRQRLERFRDVRMLTLEREQDRQGSFVLARFEHSAGLLGGLLRQPVDRRLACLGDPFLGLVVDLGERCRSPEPCAAPPRPRPTRLRYCPCAERSPARGRSRRGPLRGAGAPVHARHADD